MAFFAFALYGAVDPSCKTITISLETFAVSAVAWFWIIPTFLLP